ASGPPQLPSTRLQVFPSMCAPSVKHSAWTAHIMESYIWDTTLVSVGDSIEKFCSYFDREVDAIARLKHVEDDASDGIGNVVRYRKTLIISIIDTLAGIRFPPSTFPELARSNRARFLRFLAEH